MKRVAVYLVMLKMNNKTRENKMETKWNKNFKATTLNKPLDSIFIILNRFWRQTRFSIDLSELWKHYRINNSKNKSADLIANILNINDEDYNREHYKNELIRIYDKSYPYIRIGD